MRVLFDGYWWVGGPPSGRHVLQDLVNAWHQAFPNDEVLLAVPHRHLAEVRAEVPGVIQVVGLHSHPHAVAAALEIPIIAQRRRVDVCINQNFAPAWGYSAIFLHDVLFQTNPEWFTRAERLYFSLIPLLARRANVVFTSSASEAARISRCNPSAQRPIPVGLAVSQKLLASISSRPSEVAEGLSFILSVGRLNVRKNLLMTIIGAEDCKSVTPECPLIVVGESDGKLDDESPAVRQGVSDGRVRFLGYVSDSELRWLYENARLFLFLSLDEGFGLPPLEALSFGRRVLVSDIPVFRETLSGCAAYTDPLDAPSIAAAIDSTLSTSVVIGSQNHPRAVPPMYSWSTTVRAMRDSILPGLAP